MRLNNEQDAIKQAVGAGWKSDILSKPLADYEISMLTRPTLQGDTVGIWFRYAHRHNQNLANLTLEFLWADIAQDPAFWQALGKARGWATQHFNRDGTIAQNHRGKSRGVTRCNAFCEAPSLYHAVKYFETKLSGGDINQYWQSLP